MDSTAPKSSGWIDTRKRERDEDDERAAHNAAQTHGVQLLAETLVEWNKMLMAERQRVKELENQLAAQRPINVDQPSPELAAFIEAHKLVASSLEHHQRLLTQERKKIKGLEEAADMYLTRASAAEDNVQLLLKGIDLWITNLSDYVTEPDGNKLRRIIASMRESRDFYSD